MNHNTKNSVCNLLVKTATNFMVSKVKSNVYFVARIYLVLSSMAV